jgi:hypothetical protein
MVRDVVEDFDEFVAVNGLTTSSRPCFGLGFGTRMLFCLSRSSPREKRMDACGF